MDYKPALLLGYILPLYYDLLGESFMWVRVLMRHLRKRVQDLSQLEKRIKDIKLAASGRMQETT